MKEVEDKEDQRKGERKKKRYIIKEEKNRKK